MKCVEITQHDDGTLTVVECEPESKDMEGMGGEGAGESFNDMKTALLAAAKILTAERMEDPMAAQEQAQGEMDAGFKGVRGNGL